MVSGLTSSLTDYGSLQVDFGFQYSYCTQSILPCEYDFYTAILHGATHLMGFNTSLGSTNNGANVFSTLGSQIYTAFDEHFMYDDVSATTKVIDNSTLSINPAVITTFNDFVWLNNDILTTTRTNQPLAIYMLNGQPIKAHFSERFYHDAFRSPGMLVPNVMDDYFHSGDFRKWQYSLQELRAFYQMGLSLNTTYPDYQKLSNQPPRTLGNVTNGDTGPSNFIQTPPAGNSNLYTTTTSCHAVSINVGASTISGWDPQTNQAVTHTLSLNDPDGDPLSVYNGQLFAISGCSNNGTNGNNHTQLTINPANTIITYTPRPDFIGRAQFSFHLYDGIERGSYIVVTIDVTKDGTCFATSCNMVVNGNCENGEEYDAWAPNANPLLAYDMHTKIDNTLFRDNYIDGNLIFNKLLESDGVNHPTYSRVVTNVAPYYYCAGYDANYNSYGINPPVPVGATNGYFFPLPVNGSGRYLEVYPSRNVTLTRALSPGSTYTLEFDAYTLPLTNLVTLPASFKVGALFNNSLNINEFPSYSTTFPGINAIETNLVTITAGSWVHVTYTFTYSGSAGNTFMQLVEQGSLPTLPFNSVFELLLDNISLQPQTTLAVVPGSPTICTGSSVQLQTSGIGPFTWSPTATLSCSACTSTTASPSTTTIYTVTGTALNGCPATGQATVTVVPPPVVTISGSSSIPPSTLTASPTGTGYTYQWSNSSGPISGATSASYTATAPGTYTVKVSLVNTSNCSTTASITIGTYPSCNTTITNTPGTIIVSPTVSSINGNIVPATSSALLTYLNGNTSSTAITNNYIFIEHDLTIDQNIDFNNCPNIVFGAQSGNAGKIIVQPGKTLTISKNSAIRAACNYMWDGIYADNASETVVTAGCELHDMQNGIVITNGALLKTADTKFIDDNTGIYFANVPLTTNPQIPQTYQGYITNSEFRPSSNFMLPPYQGGKPAYGIYISNCQQINIGDISSPGLGNLFDNLKTGVCINIKLGGRFITDYLSWIKLYNNRFTNITGGNYGAAVLGGGINTISLFNDYEGNAIFGKNTGANPVGCIITVDNTPNQPGITNFLNCSKSITHTNFSGTVRNARFSNVVWGVNFNASALSSYGVSGNDFQNSYYAMTLVGNVNGTTYTGNTVSTPSIYNLGFNSAVLPYPIAISISNSSNASGSNVRLQDNIIAVNSFAGVGIGIGNGGEQISAVENHITLLPTSSASTFYNNLPLAGIMVSNGSGSQYQGNHVTGNTFALNTPRANVAGMSITESPNLLLQCNHISTTKFGFLTVGNCRTRQFDPNATTQNAVLSNEFDTHVYGILFRHNGNEGTFGDIGTTRYDNGNRFNLNQYAQSGGHSVKVYRVTPCNPQIYTRIYTTTTLTTLESGATNASCAYNVIPNNNVTVDVCPSYLRRPAGHGHDDLDTATAIRIAKDSVSYPEFQDGADWIAAQQLYKQLYDDRAARAADPVLDSFYAANTTSVLELIRACNAAMAKLSDSTVAQDSALTAQYMDAAMAAGDAIVPGDLQESNEQLIDSLYIRYRMYGLDSLTIDDSTAIANIALQCPFLGGTAVYTARTLYALFVPPVMYDDIAICNNAGVYRGGHGLYDAENEALANTSTAGSIFEKIVVSPNPTTGRLNIAYTLLPASSVATIDIIDLYGRKLISAAMDVKAGRGNIDLSAYSNGIYYYRFIVDGQQRYSGKIVLTK